MGKNWAIAIGINQYRNLQPLDYARRDAEAMQAFFQQELGIQTVYHFSDDAPPIPQDYGLDQDASPTYGTLRRFFRARFEQPFLQPGDNLWFFFAGHGKRHEDRDYLMPMDADPGDVADQSTWIPLSFITDRLRRSGADNIVMLIDACRSGEGRRDGLGFGQEKQQGVITLFACSPWESSYEIAELEQGAFTHALLESLSLEGEGNCATVERLYQRLRQTVPQITQHYKRVQQTPYGVVEPPTKYHLILLPRKANLTDIVTLKNDALNAEVRQDFKLAKQLWIRVLAVSYADHDAIAAIERLALTSATSPPSSPSLPTFAFAVITVDAQGRETNRRPGQAAYFTEDLGNGVLLDLVSIPTGEFQMGSPESEAERASDESPQHQVKIPGFWMGKYAVTQAQWQVVASQQKVNCDLNPDPSHFKGDSRPVEQVSWNEAVEFCDRLSRFVESRLSRQTGRAYRLPTESEWEYACRAVTTTPFHFGETITSDLANYDGNSPYGAAPKGLYRELTTPVGSFPPNAFGLYDMHGNVWEWCLDHWHENYQGAPMDGSAWIMGGNSDRRLLRGGSWYNDPRLCRSASRYYSSPDNRSYTFGFRVICSAP